MRLKLYCNRYEHFKDPLVCSVNCAYRTRCRDFALFYDERREEVDALVAGYYETRRDNSNVPRTLPIAPAVATPVDMRALIRLEVIKEMAEAMYVWIDKEDRAELLDTEEVIRRAERGSKAKHIYRVSQEMELRFQLVPRKRIEKAKRTAADEAERAQARRARTAAKTSAPAPVPFPAPVVAVEERAETTAPRRTRARAAKAAGEK